MEKPSCGIDKPGKPNMSRFGSGGTKGGVKSPKETASGSKRSMVMASGKMGGR